MLLNFRVFCGCQIMQEKLETLLGFLVSLIRKSKNGLKLKLEDNFIKVKKVNPEARHGVNLSSFQEEENGEEKEKCHAI